MRQQDPEYDEYMAEQLGISTEEYTRQMNEKYALWEAKEPHRKAIHEKLAERQRLLAECEALAIEHGLSFRADSGGLNEYVSEGALALGIDDYGCYGDDGPRWEDAGWQSSYC